MTKWVDIYAASFVKCCDAGRVFYPDPCPWHGTTDGMYIRLAEDPERERLARVQACSDAQPGETP